MTNQIEKIKELEEVLKTIRSMQFDKNNEENVITIMINKVLKTK